MSTGPYWALAGEANQAVAKAAAKEPEPALDPAAIEIERRARTEALRRFPALASANSAENQEFLQAVSELKQRGSAMLKDPEWPIRLAEILAQRSNWQEAADSEDEVVGRGAAPPATPPSVGPE